MEKKNQIKKINQLLLKLDLIVKRYESNYSKIESTGNNFRKGFVGVALRNEEFLKSNDQLNQQLDKLLKELSAIKQKREEEAARKEVWTNRKRFLNMTAKTYTELMRVPEGPTYINLRTRITFCICVVTGIQTNKLLPLKVN
jgi:septation ring formation regulator EzrA